MHGLIFLSVARCTPVVFALCPHLFLPVHLNSTLASAHLTRHQCGRVVTRACAVITEPSMWSHPYCAEGQSPGHGVVSSWTGRWTRVRPLMEQSALLTTEPHLWHQLQLFLRWCLTVGPRLSSNPQSSGLRPSTLNAETTKVYHHAHLENLNNIIIYSWKISYIYLPHDPL